MTARAWTYIWTIFGVAAALAVQALLWSKWGGINLTEIEVLFGLAIATQLFKVEAPNHVLFHATPIFFFAGAILLSPPWLFLLILVPHVAEWVKERWTATEHLSAWYLQPFNVAMLWVASRAAQELYLLVYPRIPERSAGQVVVILAAAALYVAVNHALLGMALVLARGMSWKQSGILQASSLVNDLVLVAVGSVVAVLWLDEPWFIVPALAPLGLMYQALMVPRLKQEAEMDGKTGLYNARRFNELFEGELDRAQRFDRPLAVVMADMDYLREVNNAYGHLAGDAVIAGIGEIIRNTVRDYDIAGRFGGEEYALVLPEVNEGEARVLAERLRRAIEAAEFTYSKGSQPIHVTMSLGVASFPDHGATAPELVKAADAAVYAAKSNGRNQVVCVSDMPDPTAVLHLMGVEEQAERTAQGVSGVTPVLLPAIPVETSVDDVETVEGGTWGRNLMISGVVLAGTAVTLLGFFHGVSATLPAIGLLAVLAVVAELLEVDLFGAGTVSVSVGIAFTAALLTGVPGLACVSATIVLVHHVKQRRGLRHVHRAAFNWAVHVLAGLGVVFAVSLQHLPLQAANLPMLVPTVIVAAVAYFCVETGSISLAIALEKGDSPLGTWRAHFQWLLVHYVVLCLMGLALSVTFTQMGTLGVLIFVLPLLTMHYVQKQFVTRSQENLRALQRLNSDLMHAALHDHLTGVGNERGFQETLRSEVEKATQLSVPVVLARLNVDEFKALNEERGRRQGDAILVEIAAMVRQCVGSGRAFRLAADEFGAFVVGSDAATAMTLLDRLRRDIPANLRGVTVSIGVAVLGSEDLDPDQLNEQAWEAMRTAKRRGRNTIIAFDEIREKTLVASSVQAQGVRRLLAEGRVSVVFQPIWDIDRRTILGYEGLARPAEEYGLSGPEEAFDVAGRIGRAHDLDALCRAAIFERALELPEIPLLFVNLAPESLENDRVSVRILLDACAHAGVRPERVVLEITERSVSRPEVVALQAERLRQAGFRLALDDTGAGNAGLGVLSQLRVDFVKIDRSVVSNSGTDRGARAVLAGIYALAREMGAAVIAEGIETVEMLDMVNNMSRSLTSGTVALRRGVQGYLLGRPSDTVLDAATSHRELDALLDGPKCIEGTILQAS